MYWRFGQPWRVLEMEKMKLKPPVSRLAGEKTNVFYVLISLIRSCYLVEL